MLRWCKEYQPKIPLVAMTMLNSHHRGQPLLIPFPFLLFYFLSLLSNFLLILVELDIVSKKSLSHQGHPSFNHISRCLPFPESIDFKMTERSAEASLRTDFEGGTVCTTSAGSRVSRKCIPTRGRCLFAGISRIECRENFLLPKFCVR